MQRERKREREYIKTAKENIYLFFFLYMIMKTGLELFRIRSIVDNDQQTGKYRNS